MEAGRAGSTARAEPAPPEEGVDLLGRYLRQIADTQLLTAKQEVELAKRIEAGVYAARLLADAAAGSALSEERHSELQAVAEDGALAKDHMVRANLRLVVAAAKRFPASELSLPDLIQEGNLGLIHAVEMFDYAQGYKFSTYAMWWIRHGMQRGIAAGGRNVKLPAHVLEDLHKMRRVEPRLEGELGREPTVEEVAAMAELSPERVTELHRLERPTISLQAPVGGDEQRSIGDVVQRAGSEEAVELLELADLRRELRRVVGTLPPREALIICLRYGLQDDRRRTLKEVADHVGLTPERVRQLEKQSLMQLRDPDRHHGLLAWAS